MTLELRQVERDGVADLPAPDLGVPGCGHEHFRRELYIEGRSDHHRVAGKRRQISRVVVPEIPDLTADDDVGRDPKRQRRGAAEGGFALGVAGRGLRDLGLVKQIEACLLYTSPSPRDS